MPDLRQAAAAYNNGLLKDNNDSVSRNLLKETEKRGLDPQRLVFAERMNLPDYLARYRTADLFLDTLPFNATGTTASDALWARLPVLTCAGEAFAGRMGSSGPVRNFVCVA